MAPNTTFQKTCGVMKEHITCNRPKTVCWDINLYVDAIFATINATQSHGAR